MYGAPYKIYGASYILYVAANTCMVRAVLYCAHLAIFMQYTRVFPTIQLEIPTFHSMLMRAGRSSWGFWRSNQPTNQARVQTSTSLDSLATRSNCRCTARVDKAAPRLHLASRAEDAAFPQPVPRATRRRCRTHGRAWARVRHGEVQGYLRSRR